ncbi:uncharacterized protein [Oscarella lobularis]|uniref:uncharacterized protein n=1 Tax=Oscarella lobularis TaxID=121494 RepID=UPI003313F790
MKQALLLLVALLTVSGSQYHKYENFHVSDSAIDFFSFRKCLDWNDPQVLTVNCTLSGWPWDPSKGETRVDFEIHAKKDVQMANIEANGRLVFWNGYIRNRPIVLKSCPYTDFCLVEANKSATNHLSWPKEVILEYVSFMSYIEYTAKLVTIQDEVVTCIHFSANTTRIKAFTENG